MIRTWQKAILNTIIAVVLLLLAALASGMLAGIIFGDRIRELAIKELNKRLTTEVLVNGSIDFSVFSNFPDASVIFNDVVLRDALTGKTDLLACKRISLLFDVWDLFGSSVTIKEVIVENGVLNLSIDKSGKRNFDIFKSSEQGSSPDFSLRINQARLSNLLISYQDESSGQSYLFETNTTALSGDFSARNFLLTLESDFINRKFIAGKTDYLPGVPVKLSSTLQVDLSENHYTIREAIINLADNRMNLSGNVLTTTDGNQLDLKFNASQLKIEELTALLPEAYASYAKHFRSSGTIWFEGTIQGLVSATSDPQIALRFAVEDGMISHDSMKEPFQSVNLKGSFTNGPAHALHSAVLEMSSFNASFDSHAIQGMILLRNFEKPFIDLKLDGTISLAKIQPLFPAGYIQALTGSVVFNRFFFKGPLLPIMQRVAMSSLEAGGSFMLKEVSVMTEYTHYENLNGQFDILNNKALINNLSFTSNESDLSVTGSVINFIPYFIHALADTLPNREKIGLDIQISSNSLSWTDLVGNMEQKTSEREKSSGEYYSIPSLFYTVSGSVSGKIDRFSYEKFMATDVHGKILFLGNTIYFNDFGLSAEKGSVTANGKLDISNMKRNKLELTAKLEKMDITQLFYEFDNFGQSSLTDKHLKGELNTDLALQATWDERKFNKSKLYAIAEVSIDQGELNNFEPMMALAKFVKISELKNIRFSRLQNQVEIKNEKIFIPQMMIFTNALNLQLSGSHSFENIIDYKIQLNLLKLLTSKFEKTSAVAAETDKTTEGFLNLYLTMTGPADNPLIRYDKNAVKQKIASDLKNEKNELKKVLEQEFYEQKQDQEQIKDWKAPEKIEYMEFEQDTLELYGEEDAPASLTRENQQKELDNFKNIFKPKNPAPR